MRGVAWGGNGLEWGWNGLLPLYGREGIYRGLSILMVVYIAAFQQANNC